MTDLGDLLQERGEVDQALDWYRRAAGANNARAISRLGELLHERGEVEF